MRSHQLQPEQSLRPRGALLRFLARPSCSIVLALAGMALLGYAQGPVASVQQSLKEQQFYFGEANGKFDEETKAGLRRFQIHEGIPVTGEMDSATLQALQSKQGAPEAAAASDEPAPERSVRGRARNLVQSDREFLDQLEGPEESTAPPPPSAPPAPARESQRVERVERSAPPPPPVAERAGPRQERTERREPSPEEQPQGITDAEARRFVENYLSAAEQPTPEGEVSFYADRVDYFDSGKVTRGFIAKDQQNYYRRWPSRNFELTSDPEVLRASGDNATVRFRTRYTVRGKADSAKGQIEEIVRLRRTDDGLKIIGIRERKLGE